MLKLEEEVLAAAASGVKKHLGLFPSLVYGT